MTQQIRETRLEPDREIGIRLKDRERKLLSDIHRVFQKKGQSLGYLTRAIFLKGLEREKARLGIYLKMAFFINELKRRGVDDHIIKAALGESRR